MDTEFDETLLDKAIKLQNGLVAEATGGSFGDEEYRRLRSELAARPDTRERLPAFVRRSSDTGQFWAWIKLEKATYHDRRELIWNGFRPLIDYLEFSDQTPGAEVIVDSIKRLESEHVQLVWQKALDRRLSDPDGAITSARSLVESTCKTILDECSVEYDPNADLPKLWALASEQLSLAPSQHEEPAFKAILGNCQSVVNYLATLRNRIGDAHGQGKRPVKPKPRHAELAVNLAGAMASFLVATWKEREGK